MKNALRMAGLFTVPFLLRAHSFALDASNIGAHALPLNDLVILSSVRTYPEANARVTALPNSVRVHFSGRVDPTASTIEVIDPNGARRDIGSAYVDPTDAHIYEVGIRGRNTTGTYTVRWHALSADDGHIAEGSFTFSLIEAESLHGTADAGDVTYSDAIAEGITVGLELLGTAIFTGVLYAMCFLWRPLRRNSKGPVISQDQDVDQHLRHAIQFGALLVAIGLISYLLLKTGEIQVWQDTQYEETFGIFLSTIAGKGVVLRAVVTALFVVLFSFSCKKIIKSRHTTPAEILLFALLLFLAYARTDVSHIAASMFMPSLSMFIGTAHLFLKLILLGLTISLAWVLLPVLRSIQDSKDILRILELFTKHASIMIGGAALSGLYVIFILLKDPSNTFTTDWGLRFIVLSIAALALLILRFRHADTARNFAHRSNADIALSQSLHYEALVDVLLTVLVGIMIATATPLGSVHNSIGAFEIVLIGSALPILVINVLLYRKSRLLRSLERPQVHEPLNEATPPG